MIPLPLDFYLRPTAQVARDLLGALIVRDSVVLRVTEVEAYGPADSACHAYRGITKRNAAMFGLGGHAYVYLCYGLHHMLNFVTEREGIGAAVLIRSCEPVAGESAIVERRGGLAGTRLLTGPGCVGQALALTLGDNGTPLFGGGVIQVCEGRLPALILAGPRVGIDYALRRDVRAPWRFADGDSHWVSNRRGLKALRVKGRPAAAHS
ncbi:MAG: DNA-3-methyladenine glycosylase [Planctomycetaceae bacterium]|nr:putative 3-methyladenine DNA glycosylase [Planctomycetota bacterium]NUO15714.1 DNA-3-methyladenine glycosylase [Planctomycetaceae bacterium]